MADARPRYTRINAMLGQSGEVQFFGLSYRTVFAALAGAAVCLSVLLIFNIPPANIVPDSPDIEELIIAQLRAGWTRLLVIGVLLAITAAAALLTAYSYFATRDKLARVQDTAKAILGSLAWGVMTIDPEGKVTIMNRAASEMLDLNAEQPYPDLPAIEALHPQIGKLLREALEKHKYVQDYDSIFVNSENNRLVLRTTVSEQRDDAGRRAGIIVLMKDVTRLTSMEDELRRADRLAAAGTLAAGVAHEIRNPLSALELNLRLLHDEIAELAPARNDLSGYCDVLFAEAKRLNRITSSFLQLSRPEPLTQELLLVEKSVQRVVQLLEPEAREKGIRFHLELSTPEATVMGDSSKLEQVCLNILINAMQAMPSGGSVHVSSHLIRSDQEARVAITFRDQGIGIPPENLQRLFDPYFTTRGDGTGLGLAIADRIITDHNGTIAVDSSPGAGASVTISLPLAAVGCAATMEVSRA